MRNISFALTTEQIRDRSKTVTRRLGWKFLKPGTLLMACVKCQGIEAGTLERICPIVVTQVDREPLNMLSHSRNIQTYGRGECAREGFPDMHPHQFVAMFCHHMGCDPVDEVTRIEFRYLPGGFSIDESRTALEESR